MMSAFPELPQIAPVGPERADAARNRERILCTARRLFAERSSGCVSMEEIADAAGVGKGTLFRRFGSRAALIHAVISEQERRFQEAAIRGEPPLGPGAPAIERLIAFGCARLDFLAEHAALIAGAEAGEHRYAAPAYEFHRLHVSLLVREADPACDAEYLTETLLSALAAGSYLYLRSARGLTQERIKEGWSDLVRRVLPRARAGAAASAASASRSG
jgi:AcrR family transcriptional regulator